VEPKNTITGIFAQKCQLFLVQMLNANTIRQCWGSQLGFEATWGIRVLSIRV